LIVLVVAAEIIPARERLPALVIAFVGLKKLMVPVVPRVNDWPFVVPRVPLPVI